MRIKVIHTITGVTEEFLRYERKVLERYATSDMEFNISKIEKGAASIESRFDEYLGSIETFRLVREAELNGYDGILLTCFANANLEPSREIATIPVVSTGMSAMLLAASVGHRFGFITSRESSLYRLRHEALKLGLENKVVIFQPCELTVHDLIQRRKEAMEAFLKAAKTLISKADVDVILPACFGMIGIADDVRQNLGIPVIDPAGAAVGFIETLVRMNIAHSKAAYPFPKEKERDYAIL